eukprot:NODE_15670_length_1037_cov_2.970330.p1 GENE.NODE_15670_length_1037_cov_2.970330~~NODE_15670_length_1037_cov_2.970330.p1  ORF type:complete len:279 (-),score=64.78 NODE_15670_length_1037_cov_2.970330:104-940(-)
MLLTPPVAHGGHPVSAISLMERCISEAGNLTTDERFLVHFIHLALTLLPWNRHAVDGAKRLEALPRADAVVDLADPPVPFCTAAMGHLAPHVEMTAHQLSDRAPDIKHLVSASISDDSTSAEGFDDAASTEDAGQPCRVPEWQGVFVAREIQEALSDISVALSSCDMTHTLVLGESREPHIAIRRNELGGDAKKDVAIIWGSTLHHVMHTDSAAESPLSPAARFQAALLQEAGKQVVVVPYWWWPSASTSQDKGQALLHLMREESRSVESAAGGEVVL